METDIEALKRRIKELESEVNQYKESEKKFRAVFQYSMNAIIIAKDNGDYVSVNPAAADMFGYTVREMEQMNVADLRTSIPPDAGQRYKKYLETGWETGEFDFVRHKGEVKVAKYHAFRIKKDINVSILTDITKQKKAELALEKIEERYKTLLEHISDSVYILDKKMNHLLVNDAAVKFTGIPKKKLTGGNLAELFPDVENSVFYKTFRDVLKKRQSQTVEDEFHFADGRKGWYEVSVYPVPEGILCISKDISARKYMENRLKDSEDKYSILLNNTQEGIFVLQGNHIVYANPAIQKITGYSEKEIAELEYSGAIYEEDREMVVENYKRRLQGENIPTYDMRIKTKSGAVKWFSLNATKIAWNDAPADLVFVQDISERKKQELQLKKSEDRLKRIIENMPVMLDAYDENNKIVAWNSECEKVTGYSKEEIFSHPDPMSLLYPDKEYLEKITQELVESNYHFRDKEWKLTAKDGTPRYITWNNLSTVYPIEGWRFWATGVDTTARKLAEMKLAEREKTFRTIFEQTSIGMVSALPDGRMTDANRRITQMLGYTKEELCKLTVDEITHPGDLPAEKHITAKVLAGEMNYFNFEKRFIKKNGDIIWGDLYSSVIRNKKGEILFVIGAVADITEWKKTERIVRDTKEKLELALKIAGMGIWDWDVNTHKVDWYGEHAALFGIPLEKFGGTIEDVQNHVHPDDRRQTMDKFNFVLQTGTPFDNTYRVVWPDGSIHWLHSYGDLVRNDSGLPLKITGTTRDITGVKEYQDKIHNQNNELKNLNELKDKLFSIIGHDLKNPVGNIIGFAEILRKKYDQLPDEKIKKFHDIILEASKSISELLQNLLKWSRSQSQKSSVNPEKIDLHDIVSECIDYIRVTAQKKHIQIKNKIYNHILVYADAEMVKTIFRNLISNAVKFSQEHGSVSIEIISDTQYTRKFDIPDKHILIAVSDKGIGMSPETIDNLFILDKENVARGTAGETGTGLGLVICKDFVEMSGGKIRVESRLDEGSTFYFSLPKAL